MKKILMKNLKYYDILKNVIEKFLVHYGNTLNLAIFAAICRKFNLTIIIEKTIY